MCTRTLWYTQYCHLPNIEKEQKVPVTTFFPNDVPWKNNTNPMGYFGVYEQPPSTTRAPPLSLVLFLGFSSLFLAGSRNSVVFSFRAWPTETRSCFHLPLFAPPADLGMTTGGKNWLGYPYRDDILTLIVVVVVAVVTRVLEKHYPKHAIKSTRRDVG